MSPPPQITSYREDGQTCSISNDPAPHSSSESIEIVSVSDGVAYVHDNRSQTSYARPAESLRQPTHVLLAAPAATPQERRVALVLGRVLERVIGEMEHNGEAIPAEAYD